MYSERKYFNRPEDFEFMNVGTNSKDPCCVHMTGESIDRIYKKGVLVDEIVSHNLVVDSFLNLVMCLMKRQDGYSGLQYWAVGSGSSSWDSNPVNPESNETRLTTEIGRVSLSQDCFSFLNSDYEVVSTPSNILQVRRVFVESECNGVWREFGIFGGNATETANSGIMINKRIANVVMCIAINSK